MRLDTDKFAKHLRKKAVKKSQGRCAFYVRLALQAGGARLGDHPTHAKDYGRPCEELDSAKSSWRIRTRTNS